MVEFFHRLAKGFHETGESFHRVVFSVWLLVILLGQSNKIGRRRGGHDLLGGLHFTVLAREFLLFAGLAGSFAVAFLFSLATFFTCLRGRVSERRQTIEKKGALCPSENLLLPYVWPFVGAVHGWG